MLDRFKERFECWNRDELDLMQDMYAEDAVFDVSAVFTDVAPMRGHQNMRRYWNELRETWDGVRIDPLEGFDVGDGRYVVGVRLWGKGQRSGAEVDQRFAFLYTLRPEDGKVIRAQLLRDVGAAISVAESSA
jgi:ketosteroid isomerase-like protein